MSDLDVSIEADRPAMGTVSMPVAYGLALSGSLVGEELRSLLPVDGGPWPQVKLDWEPKAMASANEVMDDDRASLRCLFGGNLLADRMAMSATFCNAPCPDPHVLAHPGLAGVALVFARWLGRSAFHGGAVLSDQGAWGVVGAKGRGKTTTLAALALNGHDVLADDMVVLDGSAALTGPRTLDLRPSAAEHMDGDFTVVTVRGGERRRLVLGSTVISAPFRGWIFLGSAPQVTVERIPPAERLAALAEHLAVRLMPRDPVAFLELASLPAYRVGRPLSWDTLPAVISAIQEVIGKP